MSDVDASTRALRRVLGRGSIYTVGSALQLGAGLLVLPLLTRLLEPEEYGIVAASLVVTTILTILATAGLPFSILRVYFIGAQGPRDAGSLISMTAISAVGVTAIAALTGPLWSQMFGDIPYGGALAVATWSAIPLAVMRATQNLMRAAERVGAFVLTTGLSSIGAQGLGLLVAIGGGATGYLVGLLAGYLVAMVAGLWVARGTGMGLPGRALARSAIRVGLPAVPHGLAYYVMSAGDRVIVERLLGLAAVGRYHLAYALGALGLVVLNAVNNAWAPVVFRASPEDRWRVLSDTSVVFVWLASLLAAVLAAGAPLVLAILAPPDYDLDTLAPVSAIVAGSVIPWAIYTAHSQVQLWVGRTGMLAIATPAAAAVNVGLNIVLIPELEFVGAALATVVAYGLLALLIAADARRLASVPWRYAEMALASLIGGGLVTAFALEPTGGMWTAIRVAEMAVLGLAAVYVGERATGARGVLRERRLARATTGRDEAAASVELPDAGI
jgi:O-antigen/teichoic acid export membrane protein